MKHEMPLVMFTKRKDHIKTNLHTFIILPMLRLPMILHPIFVRASVFLYQAASSVQCSVINESKCDFKASEFLLKKCYF